MMELKELTHWDGYCKHHVMFQTYLCNIFTHYLPVNNGKSVTGILRNFNMTHNLCTIRTSLLQLLRKQTYLSQSLQIENKNRFYQCMYS